MLFSYKELSRLIDLSKSDVTSLVSRLTFAGFEVEGVSSLAQADKLVIGQVLTCEKHPDSDHLHVLSVDCGPAEGILDIVCGAPNVRKGLKVIVALVGCNLPAISETIKKGVIRGKESNGMCCSLLELGVSKESLPEGSPSLNGIEELPSDAPVGEKNVLSYLGLDDTILDINVLPNRPDCLSYIGMAREISSLTGFQMSEIPSFQGIQSSHLVKVESLASTCLRFDGIAISDIHVKESTPLEVKRLLMANGIRPVDPVVDLGNYVMLLTGQPLNMYDLDKNPSKTFLVKDDYEGKFVSFDGKELDLVKSDIVVTDKDGKPLCLAGIMAGKEACVDKDSRNIFIEAADFYHANIRHTCSRLGLSSPSSQLFSKGRNPKMIDEALAVLLDSLDLFLSSYQVTDYASDCHVSLKSVPFAFSYEALNRRLGSSYTKEQIDDVIQAFRIKKLPDGMLLPPVDRVDLKEQCDIDEEVFRFYPADFIKPSLAHFPVTQGGLTPSQKMKREIRELLVDRGFDEILSFTLISEKQDASIRVFNQDPSYRIQNPMTKDHEVVRSDLLPSMLETINYNVSHQNGDLALFEVSDMDMPKGNKTYLSIALRGSKTITEKYMPREYDFYDMKGTIEAIFNRLGINPSRYRLSYSNNLCFHPKASADIFMGKDKIGTFGQLHPSFCKDKVFLAELDFGYLCNLKGLKTKFASFASFPLVRRDLSFRLNDKVTYAQLKKAILSTKNSFVREVEYFDDFTDKETGNRYLGVSVLLGKEDGTLNDAEITSSLENIIGFVKSNFGLTLRGEENA